MIKLRNMTWAGQKPRRGEKHIQNDVGKPKRKIRS